SCRLDIQPANVRPPTEATRETLFNAGVNGSIRHLLSSDCIECEYASHADRDWLLNETSTTFETRRIECRYSNVKSLPTIATVRTARTIEHATNHKAARRRPPTSQ